MTLVMVSSVFWKPGTSLPFSVFEMRQSYSVALEPVLVLALIDQADLKLTKICSCLCLPSDGIKGIHQHCLIYKIFMQSILFLSISTAL